jgi:hypothetical protein
LACPRTRSGRCPGKIWSGSHRSNCHHPMQPCPID